MNNTRSELYLCLDQGGHASRAALFDSEGNMHSLAFRDIATQRDGSHVEHDPQELLESLQLAAEELLVDLGDDVTRVVAAGIATQRSSIVCWDRVTGEPLSPVISWQDRRAADWLVQFEEQEPRIHAITGLVLSPHYGVSKLRWCLDHFPEVAAARESGRLAFGPLASWVANRLSVQSPLQADPANASRTLLWDRQTLDWSDELLQLFGIPADCLPQTVPSRHDWGTFSCAGANIPLRVVTGDQSAALFAFGAPDTGTVYANLGTGAFLQRCISAPNFDPGRLLASVVYQDGNTAMSVLEATINGAGSAINKFAADAGMEMEHVQAHSSEWLDADAELPLYLNAVSGLGSPWWLSTMTSGFEGAGSDKQKMAAVIESIAFLIAVNIEAGDRVVGKCTQVLVTGGLASIDPLLQRIADLTVTTVVRAEMAEATARGLAYLLAEMPSAWPSVNVTQTFEAKENVSLMERFHRWRELMPATNA